MKTHQDIDRRSLALARAVVEHIDHDPDRAGLARAREVCERWRRQAPCPAVDDWSVILQGVWEDIRARLLEQSEEGQRLRQSSPFCGVLSNRERWDIYRSFQSDDTRAT
jgi:hypothetical protein